MKTLYLDCFAGVSGDMFAGALIDLGLNPAELESELAKLSVEGFHLQVGKVDKHGIQATAFRVFLEDAHQAHLADAEYEETVEMVAPVAGKTEMPHVHGRSLNEILDLIEGSRLSAPVRARMKEIFCRLGQAEAKVHGMPPEHVHFHEVGGVDAIVDIASAAIGLEKLGIEAVFASPLHLGSGFVRSAHGILPVPAPATAELLAGVPVYASQVSGELVTPTGAAILATLARGFGPLPEMKLEAVGYGAGSRERDFPNVLRAYLGETQPGVKAHRLRSPRAPYPQQHDAPLEPGGYQVGPAVVLEASIDDSSPQFFETLVDRLLEAGALDVVMAPVSMKKSRPGILLQVLAYPEGVEDVLEVIFRESTTIGVRSYPVTKHMLPRQMIEVSTEFGPVHLKIARLGEEVVNVTPEYEDCREIALRHDLPVKEVYRLALAAYARAPANGPA